MDPGTVRLDRQGHVAIVTLDRPGRRNAMGEAMWAALDDRLRELEAALPRAVVFTGAGDKAFCAGQDLGMDDPQLERIAGAVQAHDKARVRAFVESERRVVDRLCALPVPLVAAVNGVAYGGGAELATRCDLRVVDPGALFCFSEVRLGLMPDWGGGVALARLLGSGRAADMILTARRVLAPEALALGLANRISAPGRSVDEALELAGAIAKNGPRAVRSALAVLRRAPAMAEADALALELDSAVDLIASGECAGGVAAFLSKSDPTFSDP